MADNGVFGIPEDFVLTIIVDNRWGDRAWQAEGLRENEVEPRAHKQVCTESAPQNPATDESVFRRKATQRRQKLPVYVRASLELRTTVKSLHSTFSFSLQLLSNFFQPSSPLPSAHRDLVAKDGLSLHFLVSISSHMTSHIKKGEITHSLSNPAVRERIKDVLFLRCIQ
jgi:hypothetical protein